MPMSDDRVLAIGDGNVLLQLTLVMYVSSFGDVREVHVRYYIWREPPDLYEKVHVSCNDESVGGIMSVHFQIRICEDEEACCLARCDRNRTLIVLFWYSFQVEVRRSKVTSK